MASPASSVPSSRLTGLAPEEDLSYKGAVPANYITEETIPLLRNSAFRDFMRAFPEQDLGATGDAKEEICFYIRHQWVVDYIKTGKIERENLEPGSVAEPEDVIPLNELYRFVVPRVLSAGISHGEAFLNGNVALQSAMIMHSLQISSWIVEAVKGQPNPLAKVTEFLDVLPTLDCSGLRGFYVKSEGYLRRGFSVDPEPSLLKDLRDQYLARK